MGKMVVASEHWGRTQEMSEKDPEAQHRPGRRGATNATQLERQRDSGRSDASGWSSRGVARGTITCVEARVRQLGVLRLANSARARWMKWSRPVTRGRDD
jgi:hypothetical protein